MSLFSFGASSSRQGSSSTSSGFGVSGGQGFGASFGQTFVDQAQSPFLDFLRNQAQGAFGGQQQGAQDFQSFLGGLGAQGTDNQFLGALGQQAQGNPALVAAQTGQLSTDLARQFTEQLNPAIGRQATGLGQLGGGRQGVAQGLAIQGQQRALAQGAVGFQTADAQRAQQAAQFGGQLFGQGLQQQGQFAQQGFNAQFQPGQQLAQLLGAPTVLSQQGAFDQSSQFGFNTNQSRSSSFGSSSGFNIGF